MRNGHSPLESPFRREIMKAVIKHESLSPKEFADLNGARTEKAAYHFRVLREHGLIKVVKTKQRRGALQRFYGCTEQAKAAMRS